MAARARTRGERDVPEAPPAYDAYFGMIVIALAATLIGLVFLILDYNAYPTAAAPKVTNTSTSLQ